MSQLLLERPPSTVFDEAEEAPRFQVGGASAYSEAMPEPQRHFISPTEAEWVRAQIAFVVSDQKQLQMELEQIVREIPRFQAFRAKFHHFLRSSWRQRKELRNQIIDAIRTSAVPSIYVPEVVRQCATRGGPDGLDIGIDIVSEFGPLTLRYAQSLLPRDSRRWSKTLTTASFDHDDDWFILLRGMVRSGVAADDLWPLIQTCLTCGHRGVRDAAAMALYDLGTPQARRQLELLAQSDPDPFIRESAQEFLADVEG